MSNQRIVLITGASSGFGALTARAIAERVGLADLLSVRAAHEVAS